MIRIGLATILLAASLSPAFATTPQPTPGDPANKDPANTCINETDLDHTNVVDDRTILFVMRNHAVYRNILENRCFGLKNDPNGFSYQPTDPTMQQLCSGLMVIHLNTLHNSCLLGNFEKLPPGTKG